ncbi:MAG: choice-of-anchor D domain-containing protein, partial [Acidobacteria bacterium]|nr:choice-of-anchor D domain-containing protein [Acidobacteriota bacterium]
DKSRPLVIDPVLAYSTYLGGSGFEWGAAIAIDSPGNAYVTGYTPSTDFPVVNPLPAPNDALQGGSDVFVSKLSADGSALLYSTYLGGSNYESGKGIAVDSSGNAYMTGPTSSTDFPTLNAFQSVNHLGVGNPTDAFVTKLNADGSALLYSTFLGGLARDSGNAIAVDSAGFAHVTGAGDSGNFPTKNPFQAVCGGCQAGGPDAFVAKIDATQSGADSLVYCSFIGGPARDEAYGIAVDGASNVYVTGSTNGDFPTSPGSFDTVSSGEEAFVIKVNATGSAVLYSTYLGGSGYEYGNGIAVDSSGNAYITGPTSSTDFPTLNAFQSVNHLGGGNPTDAFVTKLNADGSALLYSTFLGGLARDSGNAIAVDSAGFAYVAGAADSGDFPTKNAFQAVCGGCQAMGPGAFVAKIDATQSGADSLVYSSFIGGPARDEAFGIAVDAASNAYITGSTYGSFFPITPGSFETFSSSNDAFVMKVSPDTAPGFTLAPALLDFGDQGVGITSSYQSVRVGNAGSAALNITSITASGDFAIDASTTCMVGAPVDAGGNCTLNVSFTPGSLGALTGSISIEDNAAGSPHALALSGTGVPPAPLVSLSPGFLDFGSLLVGTTSSAQTVLLTNTGDATLNISGITVGGDFAITSNFCGTSLAPAENCTISVTFTPTYPGTRDGTLSVADNAANSPQTVELSGTGVGPVVQLVPGVSLTFSSQLVGTTSVAQTVTVNNTGNSTLNISGITVSGDFGIASNNCGTSLAAPGNCSIGVTFNPTTPGTRNGTLSIADNAANSPHTVELTGTGTDFALDVQSGGSASATVAAGSTASFRLQIEPTGFVGNVALACAFQGTAPRGASCSVTPASVGLDGTNPASFMVNVATTARSLAVPQVGDYKSPLQPRPWTRHVEPLLLALMLLAAIAAVGACPDAGRDRRSSNAAGHRPALLGAPLVATLLIVLLWSTCGGGPTPAPQTGTPAGTYTLNLTATVGGVSKSTTLTLRVN